MFVHEQQLPVVERKRTPEVTTEPRDRNLLLFVADGVEHLAPLRFVALGAHEHAPVGQRQRAREAVRPRNPRLELPARRALGSRRTQQHAHQHQHRTQPHARQNYQLTLGGATVSQELTLAAKLQPESQKLL